MKTEGFYGLNWSGLSSGLWTFDKPSGGMRKTKLLNDYLMTRNNIRVSHGPSMQLKFVLRYDFVVQTELSRL